ncbi:MULTISPECIES: translation initiation factor 2 [Paenibacillus]|uniref:translation initiation factor 2 n=1 Tax=Paenibacillus TaxID=44249 RepID=UPI002041F5BE|nr:translation initiation factor 2 [Paenibacillus camelliae]MCM3635159.1 translation initiation factor 2 [Paenibacillus camelliae]
MKNRNDEESREIKIARLALIGAAIVVIGDGIAAYAAALTLDLLENPEPDTRSSSATDHLEETQAQIDHYINELISIRNKLS